MLEYSKVAADVILFHPETFRHQEKRQACYCGAKSNDKMVQCDHCDEWFHCACIGVSEQQARQEENWGCGYCRAVPDADGNCTWQLEIPQGGRKRPRVAPTRNVRDTPKAKGLDVSGKDLVWVGPRNWEEVVAMAREGGRAINLEMKVQKGRAAKVVKEGGHHIVDEQTAAGLQAREVDNALVDDLLHQGMLDNNEADNI